MRCRKNATCVRVPGRTGDVCLPFEARLSTARVCRRARESESRLHDRRRCKRWQTDVADLTVRERLPHHVVQISAGRAIRGNHFSHQGKGSSETMVEMVEGDLPRRLERDLEIRRLSDVVRREELRLELHRGDDARGVLGIEIDPLLATPCWRAVSAAFTTDEKPMLA
jgi:hypothetical protein